MRTVAEYRHNAEECRNLAKLLTKPDDKEVLEHMAQTWDGLANRLEHDLALPDHA